MTADYEAWHWRDVTIRRWLRLYVLSIGGYPRYSGPEAGLVAAFRGEIMQRQVAA